MKKNLFMTNEEYHSRHENDGTAEMAGFCFLMALACVILAIIIF